MILSRWIHVYIYMLAQKSQVLDYLCVEKWVILYIVCIVSLRKCNANEVYLWHLQKAFFSLSLSRGGLSCQALLDFRYWLFGCPSFIENIYRVHETCMPTCMHGAWNKPFRKSCSNVYYATQRIHAWITVDFLYIPAKVEEKLLNNQIKVFFFFQGNFMESRGKYFL